MVNPIARRDDQSLLSLIYTCVVVSQVLLFGMSVEWCVAVFAIDYSVKMV